MRVLSAILVLLPLTLLGQDYPAKPERLVNDYAGVLTASEANNLETTLVAYDRETSVQISIAILKTLDGYPISDYTFNLYEKWGVGATGKDNGVLLLVSMEERKMWVTTGYGLEGALPDVTIKHIIEEEIKPYFKQKRYAEGLQAGSAAIIAASKGEYAGKGRGVEVPRKAWGVVGIVVFIILLSLLIQAGKAQRHAKLNHVPFWVAWALLSAAAQRHAGKWNDFNTGRGGFGGGFGGGGGGGFGGFGGGHSGGGGAGGGW